MASNKFNDNSFWRLKSPESYRGYGTRAEWDDSVDIEQIICPLEDGRMRGGKRLGDLTVMLNAKKVGDIVWTWYSECLIQDRVLALFRQEGFTGFEVKPVTVKTKKGINIPPATLWEVVVTGWGGMASPESGIKLIKHCSGCGHLEYSGFDDPSKIIDPSLWDGSDFFMVWPLPKFIFVTERVMNFIKKEKLTGCRLVSVEKLPVDKLLVSEVGLSPGRLSYWMPEERARTLGEPLGIY